MTLSLAHAFASAKADGADPTDVQPSHWNAAHTLTCASGVILGRQTAGVGAVEELSLAGTFMPLTGGTMTGGLAFWDAAVWDNNGVKNLTKLGIGMVPSNILDITQTQNSPAIASIKNASAGVSADTRSIVCNASSIAYFRITGTGYSPIGAEAADQLWISSNGGGGTAIGTHGAARPLIFFINNAETGRFAADGSLCIGTATGAGAGGLRTTGEIDCGGAIAAVGNITAFASDMRLKENIRPLTNIMAKVRQLRSFLFDLNEKGRGLIPSEADVSHLGMSAQEIQTQFPEAVRETESGYLTVMYDKLVPALFAAMNEQDKRIERLEALLLK
jgi:hypothetical protein